jgi:transcriptional regulator with XRE-family HTH domain
VRLSCRLRDLRGDRTVREVAAEAGVSASLISQLERGRALPKQDDVPGLERAYGAPAHSWWPAVVVAAIDFTSD